MIAVDTSSMIAFFQGDEGKDVRILRENIEVGNIVLPPLVLTELLSDHKLPIEISKILTELPILRIKNGYWERAGKLRAKILAKKLKARIADTLIAQSCLDNKVGLITRDSDFKKFTQVANLKLISH
ncbi:PIN domain-containing protein [Rickettsiales endosymbiont of Trichoplax sp. H2]|uniref:PIN domain-containing protein n=1 Tax=Rickettsiales endosymbiont of Trichoplax sp. H2 TaxID=2021221 RepID=UPI0012B2A861|nr:PIN domain-containing protein [Rickettsiales endosymbiont of Trichoplax sp. H2]MSO13557.1 hypothetical protein [Rickettsiales endosymbiont of Trichoplax sp. H2]